MNWKTSIAASHDKAMSKMKDVQGIWMNGWKNGLSDSLYTCSKALNWLKRPQSLYDQSRSRPPTISPTVELIRLSEGDDDEDDDDDDEEEEEEDDDDEEEEEEEEGYTCTFNDCADPVQPNRPCLLTSL